MSRSSLMDSMTYKINGMDSTAYKINGQQGGSITQSSLRGSASWFLATVTTSRFLERAAEHRTQPLPTATAGVVVVVVDDLIMERDLLSRVTGEDTGRHRLLQDPMPPPSSPTLSLLVATEEERQGPAANVVAQLPSSSRVQFPPDGVAPGCPMSERRHNLRAAGGAAGARAATAARMPVQEQRARASPAAGPGPKRPPMASAPAVPGRTLELAVAGPTVTTTGPGQQQEERCDACGVSAMLLRGLSSELDRARAQVALLTCQNESLRHRLKRASAEAGPGESESSSARQNLRCVACRVRPATVQLVPREHLCLCGRCSKANVACPVCRDAVGAWLTEAAPR